jgi:hypothetical protein
MADELEERNRRACMPQTFEERLAEIAATADPLVYQALDRWGHPLDYAPPKPKSAGAIAKLGAAYERAERDRNQMVDVAEFCGANWTDGVPADEVALVLRQEDAIRRRFREAQAAYCDAAYGRVRFLKWKMENSKRRVKSHDKHALDNARYWAEARVDLLTDMCPQFASAREWTDANCAFMLADHAYEVAKDKFEEAERERQRDAAFNIVCVSRRRQPHEVHL